MAPVLSFLISSGSKKKEPRCVYLSEAKASHSHKIWTDVSSSVPHYSKILMPSGYKKGTQKCYIFSSKESQRANPLQVSQRGPYGEKYPLSGHSYLSLNFPSESPVREPPPCSLTASPWAAILRHQNHWSTFHSFMSAGVPQKRSPPTYIWGKT
jgi:hypothetical protein